MQRQCTALPGECEELLCREGREEGESCHLSCLSLLLAVLHGNESELARRVRNSGGSLVGEGEAHTKMFAALPLLK